MVKATKPARPRVVVLGGGGSAMGPKQVFVALGIGLAIVSLVWVSLALPLVAAAIISVGVASLWP